MGKIHWNIDYYITIDNRRFHVWAIAPNSNGLCLCVVLFSSLLDAFNNLSQENKTARKERIREILNVCDVFRWVCFLLFPKKRFKKHHCVEFNVDSETVHSYSRVLHTVTALNDCLKTVYTLMHHYLAGTLHYIVHCCYNFYVRIIIITSIRWLKSCTWQLQFTYLVFVLV